jgi:hypothetical protein
MNMEIHKDLFTGEVFTPTRRNQKFKCSKNRVDYHNRKSFQEIRVRAFITNPLKKNHKILMELLREVGAKGTYTREFLQGKGYNLSVMTHFESYDSQTVPALFNFIYVDLLENKSTLTIYRKS